MIDDDHEPSLNLGAGRPVAPFLPTSTSEDDAYSAVTQVYQDGPPRERGQSNVHEVVTEEYATSTADLSSAHRNDAPVEGSRLTHAPATEVYAPPVQDNRTQAPPPPPYQPATEIWGTARALMAPARGASDASEAPLDGPLGGTPYKYLDKLGGGGMGDIFKALDTEVDQIVAVKLLRDPDPSLIERMDREAHALAALRHPNIVEILRYSRNALGYPYIAMELLEGHSLLTELKSNGPMPVHRAMETVLQVLSGLSAAHDAGILHRDIKLDNLFICKTEYGGQRTKIIDFGLTKELPGPDGKVQRQLAYPTEVDLFVGTPRYAAPEQVRGVVDARSDIYAVGLVFHALLSGREPFDGLHYANELLLAHQKTPLDFQFPQPISARVERILRRALAKDVSERFATADEFAQALLDAELADAVDFVNGSNPGFSDEDSNARVPAQRGTSRPTRTPLRLLAVALVSAIAFALLTQMLLRWLASR